MDISGISGSNPAEGMHACLLCLYVVLSCVGRGLSDELIPRPTESYQVSNNIQKTPKRASENVDRPCNPNIYI
jgi:hypothetical protein